MTPGYMYAYRVNIQPSGCPRKINREIVKTMVEGYSQVRENIRMFVLLLIFVFIFVFCIDHGGGVLLVAASKRAFCNSSFSILC